MITRNIQNIAIALIWIATYGEPAQAQTKFPELTKEEREDTIKRIKEFDKYKNRIKEDQESGTLPEGFQKRFAEAVVTWCEQEGWVLQKLERTKTPEGNPNIQGICLSTELIPRHRIRVITLNRYYVPDEFQFWKVRGEDKNEETPYGQTWYLYYIDEYNDCSKASVAWSYSSEPIIMMIGISASLALIGKRELITTEWNSPPTDFIICDEERREYSRRER